MTKNLNLDVGTDPDVPFGAARPGGPEQEGSDSPEDIFKLTDEELEQKLLDNILEDPGSVAKDSVRQLRLMQREAARQKQAAEEDDERQVYIKTWQGFREKRR